MVQVCQGRLQPGKKGTVRAWRSLEARQHRRLRHPNIVAALKHTTVLVQACTLLCRTILHTDAAAAQHATLP